MTRFSYCGLLLVLLVASTADSLAQQQAETPLTVEQVTKSSRGAIVVVTVAGRDGERQHLGTGFVISPDGLIATNNHVIGEARPIAVQFADGKKFDATSVHAVSRPLDLAIIKVDAEGLDSLKLGDSDDVQQGEQVVVMGNPLGLRHSVVSGVVSGTREIDEREMLQLAMPIEQGNSGGPVLDMQGRVLGIVTMKSAVTRNLGFAGKVNDLKPLIERPNPVPMNRWLTIGALNKRLWSPRFGARWTQRAGQVLVRGAGAGFGGRSLCLYREDPPERPFELAVTVKLDDEAGAAGLIFDSDGGNRHYGFYPSAGKLRLSRFDGPNVFTWQVLSNVASEHYKPGDWNRLKVRLEKDGIKCYVNGQLVIESDDTRLSPGKVGLAKFRQTEAQFKGFEVAKEIPSSAITKELRNKISSLIDDLPAFEQVAEADVSKLADLSDGAGAAMLRERAQDIERRAEELRRLANDVHTRSVAQRLREEMSRPEKNIDLARGGLLIALLDDPEVDVEGYLQEIELLADDVKQSLPEDATEQQRLEALNKHLFEENGFHGSRIDYYHQANSYLNRVIDDREGLPIVLSVLYMEVGRRLDLNMEGVGMPGHFVVRHRPAEGEPQLLDVFDDAKPLSLEDAKKVVQGTGRTFTEEALEASNKTQIVRRMLQNLLALAQDDGDKEAMLRYLEAIVAVQPDSPSDRGMRAVLRFETGRRAGALSDLDWIIDRRPEGMDLEKVREMREYFRQGKP